MCERSCLCVCVCALTFVSVSFCVFFLIIFVFLDMCLFECLSVCFHVYCSCASMSVCISLCVCVFIGLFACLCACVRVRRLSSRDVCAAQQGFISHGMRLEMSLYAQRPPKGVAKLRTKFAWCHFSSPKALRPSGRVCCPFYQSLQFFPATRRRCDKWHERLRAR